MKALFKLFLLTCIFTISACATRIPVSRVKASFYVKFKDGDVSKNIVLKDGTREITLGQTPEEKDALKAEWSDLRGYIALPVEDYNKLVNRQNL